jgi:hypothetical protein
MSAQTRTSRATGRTARLRLRLRLRLREDRGSLPMAMLVMLVGMALSAALIPMVVSQHQTTTFGATRVRSLNAAQSGVDVVVGKIRHAATNGVGDPTQLPCTISTDQSTSIPLTGSVNGGTASYTVQVYYYVSDPVAHPTATPMRCVTGQGTFDTASSSVVPSYAKIVSTGTDSSASVGASKGRTLTSIYAFEVDNSNISGGTIRIYPAPADGANQFCLDVGAGIPTEGVTQVALQPCSTSYPPSNRQVFAYRTDLTLQLTTSIGTVVNGVTYRNGLCLDSLPPGSTAAATASGNALVLNQCGALGAPVWSQQWSIDQYRSLQAPRKDSVTTGTLSGLCMTDSVHSAGTLVKLGGCDSNLISPNDAWIPSPSVGAGAAVNANSKQFINFSQFGRCLNDPNADPNALYLTAPGCRQNPNQAAIQANQKLTFDQTTGYFYFTLNGTNWCIYSQDIKDERVLLTPCSAPASGISTAQLKWTRTSPTLTPTLTYSQQYRFIDNVGRCLSLADVPPIPGDPYGTTYSVWKKGVTATCDLSTIQQWNASNNVGNSSIQNTIEN